MPQKIKSPSLLCKKFFHIQEILNMKNFLYFWDGRIFQRFLKKMFCLVCFSGFLFVPSLVQAENKFRVRIVHNARQHHIHSTRTLQKDVQNSPHKDSLSDLIKKNQTIRRSQFISEPRPQETDQTKILPQKNIFETPRDRTSQKNDSLQKTPDSDVATKTETPSSLIITHMLEQSEHLQRPVFSNGFTFYDFLKEKLNALNDEEQETLAPFVRERIEQMHQIFQVADWRIKKHYEEIITTQSLYWGMPANLIKAVIIQESQGKNTVASGKGAKGLMQLIDTTSEIFDVTDPYDPEQNIRAGILHLRWMMRVFEDDKALALAAYNAGAGRVKHYEGIPPFSETQNYVVRVLDYYEIYNRIEGVDFSSS